MQEKPCRATTVDFDVGGCGAPPPAVVAVRPNLSHRPVCLRCASNVLVNDVHLFLNCFQEQTFARVFLSCTRFPCGVKREKCNLGEKKKVCVEKATNPNIFVLHWQKHTGLILFLLCFGFKKTLNLSLFGPATTGILAQEDQQDTQHLHICAFWHVISQIGCKVIARF